MHALRRLHRVQALRRLLRVQALRRLRQVQLLRRLLPHWHLRRQLQRLKHPRWRGQTRHQLKHPRWRGQKLQLPQWRMLCPNRSSLRQQLQGQNHFLRHLSRHLPNLFPSRRRPACLPSRLPASLPPRLSARLLAWPPGRLSWSRGQLQRLSQASSRTSPWLLLRHHLFPSPRTRVPKLFPPQSGPRCYHCQATRLFR